MIAKTLNKTHYGVKPIQQNININSELNIYAFWGPILIFIVLCQMASPTSIKTPRAIWDLILTRRPSTRSKFAARIEVSKVWYTNNMKQVYNDYPYVRTKSTVHRQNMISGYKIFNSRLLGYPSNSLQVLTLVSLKY